MAETRSSSYINESLSLFKTTTDYHVHSLQKIIQQLNANTQQLNAISLDLQKLIEAKEQRQQVMSQSLHLNPQNPQYHKLFLYLS